jgi:hypothetical protein
MMSAAAEGHNKAELRSALSTIVPDVNTGENDLQFAANSAAALANAVWKEATGGHKDVDSEFVACIFAVIAANHFSFKIGTQFETAAILAMIPVIMDPFKAPDVTDQVLSSYNTMTANENRSLLAVGQSVAAWTSKPNSENFARLVDLFRLMRQHLS